MCEEEEKWEAAVNEVWKERKRQEWQKKEYREGEEGTLGNMKSGGAHGSCSKWIYNHQTRHDREEKDLRKW